MITAAVSTIPFVVAYKPRPFGDVFLTFTAKSYNDISAKTDSSGDLIGVFEEGYILLKKQVPMHSHPDCDLTDMPTTFTSRAFTEIYTLDESCTNQDVGICVMPLDEWNRLKSEFTPEEVEDIIKKDLCISMEPGVSYVCPPRYCHSIFNLRIQPYSELPRINTKKYVWPLPDNSYDW